MKRNQIFLILLLSFSLGMIRSIFINDPEFSIIKKEKVHKKINTFTIPTDMTAPVVVNLKFAKYHHENTSTIFIDARDPEDYEAGHIENSMNIPYDYHEDYEEIIDDLDETAIYIIYCNGEECSLSMDLADYFYNEKLFDNILIFEGGLPQWQEANYPITIKNEDNVKNDQTLIKTTDKLGIALELLLLILIIAIILNHEKRELNFIHSLNLSLLFRIIVGIIFIYASYEKILDPIGFSKNIHNYHVTPIFIENIVALVLPWMELIIGLFLISGLFLEGTISITITTLVFFILLLSQAVFRGIDVHCGCFKIDANNESTNFQFELIKRIIEDMLYLGMAYIIKFKDKLINQDDPLK